MAEHCIVNSERCSRCCEVLSIKESKNFRQWRSWVRHNGIHVDEVEISKISQMVRKLSKRRAKKINRRLVGIVGNTQTYFTCKHFTGSGCGNYENRPKMCSEYPYYGQTKEEFIKQYITDPDDSYGGKKGLYSDECTYYIEVK